jgi:hypothetical protein
VLARPIRDKFEFRFVREVCHERNRLLSSTRDRIRREFFTSNDLFDVTDILDQCTPFIAFVSTVTEKANNISRNTTPFQFMRQDMPAEFNFLLEAFQKKNGTSNAHWTPGNAWHDLLTNPRDYRKFDFFGERFSSPDLPSMSFPGFYELAIMRDPLCQCTSTFLENLFCNGPVAFYAGETQSVQSRMQQYQNGGRGGSGSKHIGKALAALMHCGHVKIVFRAMDLSEVTVNGEVVTTTEFESNVLAYVDYALNTQLNNCRRDLWWWYNDNPVSVIHQLRIRACHNCAGAFS